MSDRLIVGTRKGLFDFRRHGARTWRVAQSHFLGVPVPMMLRDRRDATLYAALDYGHFGAKMHRSDDDGATWEEIAPPSYDGVEGDPAPALKLVWSLEAAGEDEPDVLWAGTIPGGLFRSEDRGRSWSMMKSLWDDPLRGQWFGGGAVEPGIHSIAVDPRTSRRLTIAVSCGGVWETQDRGETWRIGGKGLWAEYMPPEQKDNPAIQDPHRLVRCPAAPEAMWIQHHNGVFRTTTGFAEWSEVKTVSPANFGFAVAVHPQTPDTAWLVPAVDDAARYPVDGRVVVARTRDGGKSFDVLTEGLPQDHAYDLVYRHGLDVDGTGERIAMGSTTGSLWLSENGGDDWLTLSVHLPPIYAVRFA